MRLGIVVQARMGSERLPGKVLATLHTGETLLELLLSRLKQVAHPAELIVATTEDPSDDVIVDVATACGAKVARGAVADVLSRYILAAEMFELDSVVRVTADCPLMDPRYVDRLIAVHLGAKAEYTRMHDQLRLPRGLGAEVIEAPTLTRIAGAVDLTDKDREHVTYYILSHRELFHVQYLCVHPSLARPHLRLTVDTPEDLQLVRRVYQELRDSGAALTAENMIHLLLERPDLVAINAHVEQRS